MLREIVLLTGAQEGPHLTDFLHRHNGALTITHAQTRDELTIALHPPRPGIRLIGFCTSVVVPAELLSCCDCQAYNFHPGPPTHPGKHPASFAIYEGAIRFGATAHEMLAKVDSGAIVGVEWFDMPPEARLSQLEGLTFDAAIRLFSRLGPELATSAAPLSLSRETWSGRKSTQRDFEQMCEIAVDIPRPELERRLRAFADGLPGALTVTLHGQRFRLADPKKP
jgi:methionyl-tRNA formyltransferase